MVWSWKKLRRITATVRRWLTGFLITAWWWFSPGTWTRQRSRPKLLIGQAAFKLLSFCENENFEGIFLLVFPRTPRDLILGRQTARVSTGGDVAAAISSTSVESNDDVLTVCAISVLAAILGNVVHEGLGHAATALLTGTQSGVLTTVAWSSDFDTRLVAAGGTLANLAAAVISWIALRSATSASVRLRFFLLTSLAFNLFAGTGYFFFSGITNFGDWAVVIAGLHEHWLWRSLLVVAGLAAYYGAVLVVGTALVQYVVG
jgi:hypothetical protein